MRKRVWVFCCGVQKGGTTSLYAHLCEHPMLSPPRRKETHFFDDETRDWSSPNYSALDAFYAEDDGDRLRFDVTPIYCFWPPSLARIRAYNPDAKLILLFRDPFERAWSQWCMSYARNRDELPFASAIREGRERVRAVGPLAPERRIFTYVERGFYAEQVERATALFPRRQLLFLRSTDLHRHHVETLRRISDFLGIAPFPDTGVKRENVRASIAYPSTPTLADLDLFCAMFGDEMTELAARTGLDLSPWTTVRRLGALASAAPGSPAAAVSEGGWTPARLGRLSDRPPALEHYLLRAA